MADERGKKGKEKAASKRYSTKKVTSESKKRNIGIFPPKRGPKPK